MEIATFFKLSFDFDLDTLVTTAENKIMELKLIKKPKDSMCNMPMVNKLRNLFNIKNRFLISDKLFILLLTFILLFYYVIINMFTERIR